MLEFFSNTFLRGSCYKWIKFLPILWILVSGGSISIRVKNGPVRGYETKFDSVSIYTFKNIPYAKPPIGFLRFQRPVDSEPWMEEENLKSYAQPVMCPQISPKNENEQNYINGQEDCLLLDVYMRKTSETNTLLPVLIYFHGGKFSAGSKEEYHPQFLLNFHDVIVVIPNYRLGILGFINNKDEDLQGNLGLWDQRKSMEWVHDNIESFGGDKNRVTIAGHDAGGASVGLHILSPQSHRFFSAAISGSGTALDPWVFDHHSKPTLPPVAEMIGCSKNESDDIIECLKMIDFKRILETQMALKKVYFSPIVDGSLKQSFLADIPEKLYQLGYAKNVSYLAGVTKNEASIEINKNFPDAERHKHLDSIIHHLLSPYMKKNKEFQMTAKAAKYHYLRGAVIKDFPDIKPQMEKMMSDFLYNSPLLKSLTLHSIRSSNTFMYVFKYEEKHSPFGVPHMMDAFYLFNKTFEEWTPDENFKTEEIRKIICDIWGNFTKSKFPGDLRIWKNFREKQETNYVKVTDKLLPRMNYRKEAMEFWNLLVPDLNYYLNLTTILPSSEFFFEDPNYSAWGLAGVTLIFFVLCVATVGVVTVARRRIPRSSILPTSSAKDHVKYANIE